MRYNKSTLLTYLLFTSTQHACFLSSFAESQTPSKRRTNERTETETRKRTNNVHNDRRRHAVRLIDPLQKTRLFVRSSVT